MQITPHPLSEMMMIYKCMKEGSFAILQLNTNRATEIISLYNKLIILLLLGLGSPSVYQIKELNLTKHISSAGLFGILRVYARL